MCSHSQALFLLLTLIGLRILGSCHTATDFCINVIFSNNFLYHQSSYFCSSNLVHTSLLSSWWRLTYLQRCVQGLWWCPAADAKSSAEILSVSAVLRWDSLHHNLPVMPMKTAVVGGRCGRGPNCISRCMHVLFLNWKPSAMTFSLCLKPCVLLQGRQLVCSSTDIA